MMPKQPHIQNTISIFEQKRKTRHIVVVQNQSLSQKRHIFFASFWSETRLNNALANEPQKEQDRAGTTKTPGTQTPTQTSK